MIEVFIINWLLYQLLVGAATPAQPETSPVLYIAVITGFALLILLTLLIREVRFLRHAIEQHAIAHMKFMSATIEAPGKQVELLTQIDQSAREAAHYQQANYMERSRS